METNCLSSPGIDQRGLTGASDLEDPVEDSPQGSHEQEDDANGVADAAGLWECGTAASGVADVLHHEVRTDDQGDDVGVDAPSVRDQNCRGGHDEEDEGSGQFQITWKAPSK